MLLLLLKQQQQISHKKKKAKDNWKKQNPYPFLYILKSSSSFPLPF